MKGVCTVVGLTLVCCSPVFGASEQNQVEGIFGSLEYCQSVGRACKLDAGADAGDRCWKSYDSCVTDAGLRK